MNGITKYKTKDSEYSALYQTPQTRQLDEIFGLTGEPVSDEKISQMQHVAFQIGRAEEEIVMPYFACIAGKVGNFVGVPLNEVERATKFKIVKALLVSCAKNGYLEQFTHDVTMIRSEI